MAYEMKDMTGSLWKNDKATADNHPTHTGRVMIDGVMYWQSAWVKDSNDGRRYFSQAFRRIEQEAPQKPQPKKAADIPHDDIPF